MAVLSQRVTESPEGSSKTTERKSQGLNPHEADGTLNSLCVWRAWVSYQQIAPVAVGGLLGRQDLGQRLVQLV